MRAWLKRFGKMRDWPADAARALRRRGEIKLSSRFFVACALFVLSQQGCYWLGRQVLASGALYTYDTLFGWDVPRVVADMTVPGHNIRSNVHPLFTTFAKPLAGFFTRTLGLEGYHAALWASSIMGGLATALMFAFVGASGAAAPESALFAASFAASSMPLFSGAVPETGIFSICSILIFLALAARAARGRPAPEWAWLLSGVVAYGTTISNTPKLLAAYALVAETGRGARAALARTALYGAIVVAAGAGLTWAVGSSFRVQNDLWLLRPSVRLGSLPNIQRHAFRNMLFYDVVAPSPSRQTASFYDRKNFPIVTFNESSYRGAARALAAAWGAALLASVACAIVRPRPGERRMLAILAFCVALDIACFSLYYVPFEGVFLYSAQAVAAAFAPTAFLAARISGLPPRARLPLLALAAMFLAALAANNVSVMLESLRLAAEPVGAGG